MRLGVRLVAAAALLVVVTDQATSATTVPPEGEGIRLALVLPGEINDLSWNQQMYDGAVALEEEGLVSELAYTELVPEGDAERAVRGYADDGFALIVAHSFGYGETTKAVAADHPDTAFAWAGGIAGQEGNVADYEQPFHEAYYLLGILAGDVSETGILGGAGGFDIPACHSLIEAFYLGAQEVNADITGITTYVGDWIDVARGKEAAAAAADEGADVFAACGEGPVLGQIELAQERGLLATGYVGDMSSLAPDTVLASMVWDTAELLRPMIEDVQAGTFIPAKYYSIGVAEDGLLVVINPELADLISDEAMELLKTRSAEIKDGSFEVPFIPERSRLLPRVDAGRAPALQVVGVARRFGDVQALRDVDLDIRAGEVLAILGENGAGKTTLMRILAGLDRPSSGTLLRAGEPFAPASPREAVERGVTLVQQHFALVPTMVAVDNLLLFRAQHHQRRSRAAAAADLQAQAARLGFEIDPAAPVASMSVGERQRLELLRALDADPEVLLLDEPTAVLTDAEADRFLDVARHLAADGRAVVLITHRLREVVEAADRVAVMRSGAVVSEPAPVGLRTRAELAHEMVGEELPPVGRTSRTIGRAVVEVADLRVGRLAVERLAVHAGEVLGVAGVDGNGQGELELALTGLAAPDTGTINVDGEDVAGLHPRGRVAKRIAYIPSDRTARALVGTMRCDDNLALGRTTWRIRRDPAAAARMAAWSIKGAPDHLAMSLSGGNAQKLVAARELHGDPIAIVACQPTSGLDPAAATQLRGALLEFADRGGAVLWIAAELDELLEVADRIVVAFHGRLSEPFHRPFDRRLVGLAMGGGG